MSSPTHIGDIITPKALKKLKRTAVGLTPTQKRIIECAALHGEDPNTRSLLYQHSAFCQVFFPYRDPGDEVSEWQRSNGVIDMLLAAGHAKHPDPAEGENSWVKVPLPYGPKSRLVLMHMNQVALRTQSPHIDLEDSLTAFVRRILRLEPYGRNITMVKEQLRRLAASSIRLGFHETEPDRAHTTKLEIVKSFDLWFPKDDRQRVLWPTYLELSPDYFESLMRRAVPLPEHHIAALSHSGLAMDIYAWLAQRLHRIPPNKPAFVTWAALHGQFGQGYTGPQALKKFRAVFREALKQVLALYKDARITDDRPRAPSLFIQDGNKIWKEPPAEGLTLHHSPPPATRRLVLMGPPAKSEKSC